MVSTSYFNQKGSNPTGRNSSHDFRVLHCTGFHYHPFIISILKIMLNEKLLKDTLNNSEVFGWPTDLPLGLGSRDLGFESH